MDLSAPQGVRGYPSGLSIAIYVHIRSGGIPEHPRVRGVSQWALCYSIYHELYIQLYITTRYICVVI